MKDENDWRGKVKNEPTARFRNGETLGWLDLADQANSEMKCDW